jgi:hypothetical protein
VPIISAPKTLASAGCANNTAAPWTAVDNQVAGLKGSQHFLPESFLQRCKSVSEGQSKLIISIALEFSKGLLSPSQVSLSVRFHKPHAPVVTPFFGFTQALRPVLGNVRIYRFLVVVTLC